MLLPISIARCYCLFLLPIATPHCHFLLPLPIALAHFHCLLPIAIAYCHCLLPLPFAIACCHCLLPLLIAFASTRLSTLTQPTHLLRVFFFATSAKLQTSKHARGPALAGSEELKAAPPGVRLASACTVPARRQPRVLRLMPRNPPVGFPGSTKRPLESTSDPPASHVMFASGRGCTHASTGSHTSRTWRKALMPTCSKSLPLRYLRPSDTAIRKCNTVRHGGDVLVPCCDAWHRSRRTQGDLR